MRRPGDALDCKQADTRPQPAAPARTAGKDGDQPVPAVQQENEKGPFQSGIGTGRDNRVVRSDRAELSERSCWLGQPGDGCGGRRRGRPPELGAWVSCPLQPPEPGYRDRNRTSEPELHNRTSGRELHNRTSPREPHILHRNRSLPHSPYRSRYCSTCCRRRGDPAGTDGTSGNRYGSRYRNRRQPSLHSRSWGPLPHSRTSAPLRHNHTWGPKPHSQHRHHTSVPEPHRTTSPHSRCRNRICDCSHGHNHTSWCSRCYSRIPRRAFGRAIRSRSSEYTGQGPVQQFRVKRSTSSSHVSYRMDHRAVASPYQLR